MKVAFVYPYIPYRLAKTPYPPLGIGYISASIRQRCLFVSDIKFIDGQMLNEENFWITVNSLVADVILISISLMQIKVAETIAERVKRVNPQAMVILGGAGASTIADSPSLLNLSVNVDIISRGEGEDSIPLLLDRLNQGISYEDVPNLAIRKDDQFFKTSSLLSFPDINAIPSPDRSIFDEELYLNRWRENAGVTSVHIIGSRGCPFSCSFCDRTISGKKVRYRDPINVAEEMIFLEKRYAPNDIFFFDDLFTLNKKHVMNLCVAFKDRGLQTAWSAQARVDCVDREMLTAMYDSGCKELCFGVESGSDRILQYLHKGFTRNQIIEAFDLCHDIGIKPGAYFIVAVPTETRQDILDSVSLVERISPALVNVSFLTPFPNTPLYANTLSSIGEWDYEKWDDFEVTVYDYEFEVSPQEAHDMIYEAYQNMINKGMRYSEYSESVILNK